MKHSETELFDTLDDFFIEACWETQSEPELFLHVSRTFDALNGIIEIISNSSTKPIEMVRLRAILELSRNSIKKKNESTANKVLLPPLDYIIWQLAECY